MIAARIPLYKIISGQYEAYNAQNGQYNAK